MKHENGTWLLAVCAAFSFVGCERSERRPEPAPAINIIEDRASEEPGTYQLLHARTGERQVTPSVGRPQPDQVIGPHEPDRSPTVESNGNMPRLEMSSASGKVSSETVAPVITMTPPVNNPVPAPLRPRSDVPPLPCSGDSMLGEKVGGKTCIMEVILNEDFTVREAHMVDGRIFTYDPNRSRLLEHRTITEAELPWYDRITNEQIERYGIPTFLVMMTVFALIGLVRFIRHRRSNRQDSFREDPLPNHSVHDNANCMVCRSGYAGTPPSHQPSNNGGLTEEQMQAALRQQRVRLETCLVDERIKTVRATSEMVIEDDRDALRTSQRVRRMELGAAEFLDAKGRQMVEASIQAEIEQIDAATATELARLSALRAGYEAHEEETTGVYYDLDGAFEEREPQATETDNINDDPDDLENSQIRRGEDDDLDPDDNV